MPTDDWHDYRQKLREEALSLPPETPAPWTLSAYIHAGGVIAAGWDSQENVILVSHDGYSVCDPRTGERLIRDPDPEMGYGGLSETGLEYSVPATGETRPVFGIFGGGGILVSPRDHWELEIIAPDWPDEMVILREPGPGGRDYLEGAHRLDLGLAGTLRGCGFAPSGRQFIVVASDGAVVFRRDDEAESRQGN